MTGDKIVKTEDNPGTCPVHDVIFRTVFDRLKAIEDKLTEMNVLMTKVQVEIGMLRVKAGVWGLIGACVPTTIGIIWMMVRK